MQRQLHITSEEVEPTMRLEVQPGGDPGGWPVSPEYDLIAEAIQETIESWGRDELLGHFGWGEDTPENRCPDHQGQVALDDDCEGCLDVMTERVYDAIEKWAATRAASVASALVNDLDNETDDDGRPLGWSTYRIGHAAARGTLTFTLRRDGDDEEVA